MPIDEDAATATHEAGTDEATGYSDLLPNRAVLLGGSTAVALISAASLPWPDAAASTVLGALMIAGADVDARNYLLPDVVTGGAALSGLVAASALDPFDAWLGLATAAAGACAVAAGLWLLRWAYGRWRGREGIGLGDVKLGAAIGAWLPLDAVPTCFMLATSAALIAVLGARWRGHPVERVAKVPFGAFLCPALWLVYYTTRLLRG
jgi:leader peptidase (prepilin peptidase) / N-methyltransferase